MLLQPIQADVPAGGVAGGARGVVEDAGEAQQAAVAHGIELDAQDVVAPGEREAARRLELDDLALERQVAVGELKVSWPPGATSPLTRLGNQWRARGDR